jgi:cell division septation protein DedD
VSPERHDPNEDQEQDLYEDVPPRSIFAATWFRVVLVVIVLGVVGAVAVPYVLDWMNPTPMSRTASSTRPSMTPAPTTTPIPVVPDKPAIDKPLTDKPPTDKPAGDRSSTDKPLADKPPAEKKDVPAPSVSSPMTSPPARPDSKGEVKPSPSASAAKPATDPKSTAKATPADPARPAPTVGETKSPSATSSTESAAKTGAAKPNPAKPEAAAKEDASASKPAAAKRAVAKGTPPTASAPAGVGPYWVQIGAFKDVDTAKRVAAKLREENFKVEESIKRVGGTATGPTVPAPAPPGSATDQYDVFVSGMSVEELNKRLAGKGLTAEPASGGVVVKPSQPLRDAVALSKDLAVDGFKVQVRRAGAPATAPAVVSAPTAPAEGGQTLHRVRVGAFTDRAAALAAARELENKGFKPYIARGDQ